jgi:hypothetical protein
MGVSLQRILFLPPLRASPPVPQKCLPKCSRRGFWVQGSNWCTTGGPKNVPTRPRAQINSRCSHAGPCAAGSYRERRQIAAWWKKSPGPACQAKSTPKNPPSPLLPPFGVAAAGDTMPLSSSPPPPPAQKSSPALPRRRLARLPLPTPRILAVHSQAMPHPARKVFVHLPRRPLWTVMSTHASVLVDIVGPPSAEVCRAAASFP